MSEPGRIHCRFARKGQPRRSGASACGRGRRARSVILAARRGRIGHCCGGRACGSSGLRHQYGVRKTGVETHSARPDGAATAQPHCVALLRGGTAYARTDRPPDDGAEDHLAGARRFGRAPRSHRATPGHAGARRLSAGAAAGIGGSVRRSGAACAYDGRHDRRGSGACRRKDCTGPRCAGRRRSRAVDARTEGRPRVDQRYAVFDRICHFRFVARPWPGLRDAGDRRACRSMRPWPRRPRFARRSSNCAGMPGKSQPARP